MAKIKIIIAEDHPMFRDSIAKELSTDTIEVIGAVGNGVELLELLKKSNPDIILLDLRMPELDGHEVLKILSKEKLPAKIIVLSDTRSPVFVTEVIFHGASAYLAKYTYFDELIKAIEIVYREGFYFNEIVSRQILEGIRRNKHKFYYLIGDERFSEREIEVLRKLVQDKTSSQIAESLNISEHTVNFHRKNLMTKTGSESVVSLVKYAIRNGVIKGDEI